jgi:hypothetical protein
VGALDNQRAALRALPPVGALDNQRAALRALPPVGALDNQRAAARWQPYQRAAALARDNTVLTVTQG